MFRKSGVARVKPVKNSKAEANPRVRPAAIGVISAIATAQTILKKERL